MSPTTTTTVLITGNTYPHRDAFRAMGGRWDAAARGWRVPAARAADARALVPASEARAAFAGSTYRGYKRAAVCPNPRDCGDPGCDGRCGY